MPWCGWWWGSAGGLWWVLPLVGIVVMGLAMLACFRGFGFGCMGPRRRGSEALDEVRREVASVKEDVRKLLQQRSAGS